MRRIAGLRRKHQFGVAGHLDPALAVAVVVQADAAHLGIAVSGNQHFGDGLDVAVATADARATGFEPDPVFVRSEEHTSELQSLMRISYAVFCLKKKIINRTHIQYVITENKIIHYISLI